MSISIALLIRAVENNSIKKLILCGLFLGLSLYTYALSYIIIPILLFLICLYLLWCKKITIKRLILLGIPIFILALPLILMILINNGFLNEIKTFITIPKLPLYRGNELSLKNIKDNLYIIPSILSYDNQELFGLQLVYNAIPQFGTLYYLSIPLFFVGLGYGIKKFFISIKNKEFDINSIFLFWFFSVLVCMLLIIAPNINKANAIFVPLIYFVALGICFIIKNLRVLFIPIVILLIVNFAMFFYYFFNQYNKDWQDLYYFSGNYMDAISYSKELDKKDIYIVGNVTSQPYIYILLDNEISPYDFNSYNIKTTNHNYIFDYNYDENSVYIMSYDENVCETWCEYGFKSKQFGNIVVFYK
ncbi:MAG: hypothetical protein IKG42_02275 [Clostridia bacterium]|nr:hypothetical protein [Clostridia bacterium]